MTKRVFDLAGALTGLAILWPVFVALAFLVKVSSPGPVLYRGVRAGRYGLPFRIMKFRSMVVRAEALGGASTSDDDPRVTRVGRLMRRFKLDELPQLVNVLAGDMSFVGPRPEVLAEVAEYTPEQRRVLEVLPGITDWASIWNSDEGAALAGEADAHVAYKRRIQPTKLLLQLKYRDEQSILLDIKLILFTIRKVLNRGWVPKELLPYGKP